MNKNEITKRLKEKGKEIYHKEKTIIKFTENPEADALLNDLENNPHAFVLACIMGRQQSARKCWMIPYEIRARTETFNLNELIALGEEEIKESFKTPFSLHWLSKMPVYFYSALIRIKEKYNGDANNIWAGKPKSATVVRRFLEFDGIGPKISTMATNILAREFKVDLSDLTSIEISPDALVKRVFRRLGLIEKEDENILIYTAREINPEYPGLLDLPAWMIGESICDSRKPKCEQCYMNDLCPARAGKIPMHISGK